MMDSQTNNLLIDCRDQLRRIADALEAQHKHVVVTNYGGGADMLDLYETMKSSMRLHYEDTVRREND